MDIKEIKIKKEDLEDKIEQLIDEFEEETTVQIEHIYINKIKWQEIGNKERTKTEVSIVIKLQDRR